MCDNERYITSGLFRTIQPLLFIRCGCLTVHRHLYCSSNWQIFVSKRLCLAGSAAEIANASFLGVYGNRHSEQGYRCTVKQPRRCLFPGCDMTAKYYEV